MLIGVAEDNLKRYYSYNRYQIYTKPEENLIKRDLHPGLILCQSFALTLSW